MKSIPRKEPPMPLFSWLSQRITGRLQTRRTVARKPTARFRPQVEALEGRDLPSFSSPIATAVYQAKAMVTADVNNDGRADVIVMDGNGGIGGYVLLGKGNGQFTAPYYWSYGSGSYTATAL